MNSTSPHMNPDGAGPLRIGVSACFFHHDPTRPIFKGKRLLYIEESMMRWLMTNGALPILMPPAHAGITTDVFLEQVDGLLLQGGSDVSPESYGESALRPEWNGDLYRDRYEIDLIHACLRADKPVIGICRGHQIINVALGGSLYQDIEEQIPGARVHRDWESYDQLEHEILLADGSGIETLYREHYRETRGGGRIISIHHQAIKTIAPGLAVEAISEEDEIIEAVRLSAGADITPHAPEAASSGERGATRDFSMKALTSGAEPPYLIGVQWHPEFQNDGERLLAADPLLQEFLRETGRRRDNRQKMIANQSAPGR